MSITRVIDHFLKQIHSKNKYAHFRNLDILRKTKMSVQKNNALAIKQDLILLINDPDLISNSLRFSISIVIKETTMYVYVADKSRNPEFFMSTPNLYWKSNNKYPPTGNFELNNFKTFYCELVRRLRYLETEPVEIHYICTHEKYEWFLNKLAKKFFVLRIKFTSTED